LDVFSSRSRPERSARAAANGTIVGGVLAAFVRKFDSRSAASVRSRSSTTS